MTASITKYKCPKCGAMVIVDESSGHTTCAGCGTSIPHVIAKESEILPVVEGGEVERPRVDREKLGEPNASGREQSDAITTATEMSAGPIGTTFSVNSLGKVIFVVILALLFLLPTYALFSFSFSWLGGDPGNWVIHALAGFCTVGVVGFATWTSVASIVSSSGQPPIRASSRHVLSAFLIGVIWYWNNFISLIVSSSDWGGGSLLWMALIVLLSEGALGVSGNGSRIFGATGFGVLFGWVTEVMFTFTFPHISPVNHQLLPIEPVVLAFAIMPPTALGNLAGRKLALLQDKKPNVKHNKLMFWLLIIAFILALASPIAVLHL